MINVQSIPIDNQKTFSDVMTSLEGMRGFVCKWQQTVYNFGPSYRDSAVQLHGLRTCTYARLQARRNSKFDTTPMTCLHPPKCIAVATVVLRNDMMDCVKFHERSGQEQLVFDMVGPF